MKKLAMNEVKAIVGGGCSTRNQWQLKHVDGSNAKNWICTPTTTCSDKHGTRTTWDQHKDLPAVDCK
jgi:hypothetical protein